MKTAIRLFLFGIAVIMLASCSSSQTFVVHGVPGTVIVSPDNKQLAMIDNSGQASITLKRNLGYHHFLQSQTPGSNMLVPFALDYKNHSKGFQRGLFKGVAYTLAGVGLTAALVGTIAMLGANKNKDEESEDTFGKVAGIGAVVAGIGSLIGLATEKGEAINQDYDYLKQQQTNQDILR